MTSLKRIAFVAALIMPWCAWAQAPTGYYSSCEGKGGQALLTALCSKICAHTVVSYDGLWEIYPYTDVKPNGLIWDMYSTKEWPTNSQHCGNYQKVGDCYNREHSFPKSWFDERSPMKSDAFHVYPTDGKVNGQRSNHPYGECSGGTTLPSNGGVRALGRLGNSTFSGYSGTVFEPDDEYKGDLARTYFYMAACYNDQISSFDSPMLAGNKYPAFSTWAVNLLLKWHRQDPVSQKEIDRNNAVYTYQKNRNPFIDHPEMAEYIWGDKKDQSWTYGIGADPVINLPASGSTIDMGVASVGVARTTTIKVKGTSLSSAVSLKVSTGAFSVAPSSLSAASVNAANGASATITYTPSAAGSHTATLTIASGSATATVTLRGEAVEGLPAGAATNVTDESFVAHWTFIGDADANGCYTLDVRDVDGTIDGFPMSVPATDESFEVEYLTPLTTYFYTIASRSAVSNVVSVTTCAPIPSVQILHDGEIFFDGVPGEPTEAAELLLDTENITGDITISVSEPFEVSADKTNWARSIVIPAVQDRFYLRLNGTENGTYSTSIRITAGTYVNDETEVQGKLYAGPTFHEDFEKDPTSASTYDDKQYDGSACTWQFENCGIWTSDAANTGNAAVRFGKNANSAIYMLEDKQGGAGTVTFYAHRWNGSDGDAEFDLQYSSDAGVTWHSAGQAESKSVSYELFTFTVNKTGNVRIKIQQTAGGRMMLDDVEISDYHSSVIDATDPHQSWDAYSLDGAIVVETARAAKVAIHDATTGITLVHREIAPGTATFDVPAGLYIVAIGESARRVVVN